MQQITQKDLKEKFGLELPKGNYLFEVQDNKYKIYQVFDDSLGCLIVGENTTKGMVCNSRRTMDKLLKLFDLHKGEQHTIIII